MPRPKASSKPRSRVFIVNDDPSQADLICGLLEKAGMQALPFKEARSAMVALRRQDPPDLIITNLVMPVIDGWRFCSLLRSPEYEPLNQTPILVLSSIFPVGEAPHITSEIGANAFLPIPIDSRELVKTVRALLKGEKVSPERRVLIAGASISDSKKLVKAFQSHGFKAESAASLEEALALTTGTVYDAVLMDHHLPGGPGDILLKDYIARSPRGVAVMMDTEPQPELTLVWLKMGSSAFLVKPFEPEYAVAQCERSLREHALQHAEDLLSVRTGQLQESRSTLDSVLEATREGFWLLDLNGRILETNQAFCRISGYTRDELFQMRIQDLEAQEDPSATALHLQSIIASGSDLFETRHRRKDGSDIDVEVSATYTPMEGGRFICFGRDISDRRQVELSLRESEERFRRLSEDVPACICSFLADSTMTYINGPQAALFNTTPKELVGCRFFDLLDPHNLEQARQSLEALTPSDPVETHEEVYITPDGSERYLEWKNRAFFDQEGKTSRYLGVGIDITERRRAEKEVRASNENLLALTRVLQYQARNTQEFLDYALEQAIQLTASRFGYIYFYDDDRREFTLNTWSRGVMEACKVLEPQTIYKLEKTGVWGEAVRQGRPIILNDFRAPHPLKKGFPEGHVPLHTYMTIPILSDGRVVAVVGLANKTGGYTERDVLQLTLLMEAIWKIVNQRRAEEALRLSEEKFSTAFRISPDAININRLRDGMYIEINEGFTALTDYTPEETIGKTSLELNIWVNPEDRQHLVAGLREHGTVTNLEAPFRGKNGQIKTCFMSARVIDIGQEKCILSITRDITERKRAEGTARESTKLLQTVIDSSQLHIYAKDLEGRFILASQPMAEFFGFRSYEQVLGRTSSDFLPKKAAEEAHANDLEVLAAPDLHRFEEVIETPQGPLTFLSTKFPLFDSAGNINAVCGISVDITDQKRMEQDLRESESRLREILENIQAIAIILDDRGRITFANDFLLNLTGWQREEVIGQDWYDLFTIPEEKVRGNFFVDGYFKQEIPTYYNNDILTRQGERRMIAWNNTLLRDSQGNILATASIGEDITERKRIETRLEEQLGELRRWETATLGREDRVLELKAEVNRLLIEAGKQPRYPSAEEDRNA